MPRRVFEGILSERLGQLVLQTQQLSLLVFEEQQERIDRWIP